MLSDIFGFEKETDQLLNSINRKSCEKSDLKNENNLKKKYKKYNALNFGEQSIFDKQYTKYDRPNSTCSNRKVENNFQDDNLQFLLKKNSNSLYINKNSEKNLIELENEISSIQQNQTQSHDLISFSNNKSTKYRFDVADLLGDTNNLNENKFSSISNKTVYNAENGRPVGNVEELKEIFANSSNVQVEWSSSSFDNQLINFKSPDLEKVNYIFYEYTYYLKKFILRKKNTQKEEMVFLPMKKDHQALKMNLKKGIGSFLWSNKNQNKINYHLIAMS